MIKKLMNPVSWFIVFVFKVICTFPIISIFGLVIVFVLNLLVFKTIEFLPLICFAFLVSLFATVVTVLEENF